MHQRRPDHTTEPLSNALTALKDTTENRGFRAIFERAGVGMACMDRNGHLQRLNQCFCDILGYGYEELLQQGFLHITHPDDVMLDLAYLRSTPPLAVTNPYIRETLYLRKDGSSVWVRLTIAPLSLSDCLLDCFVCTIEDISRCKLLEEQLFLSEQRASTQETSAHLEQVNKVQSDFIAIISHKFRTNLTGIQGFSELLRDGDFNVAEVKEYANDINVDALCLNRVISELLALEHMKSGRVSLHRSKIDMNAILQEVAERTLLVAPNHMLRLDINESLPQFEGDYDKLMQVMINIISNAVKYAPAGGEILLQSRVEDASIHVSVRDQGIGIPEDALETIFASYGRINASKTRYIQGTGLGLAIVQQIIQMHRGHVWVESELGHGSTFHFTLPVKGPLRY